jgi:hypothetical protein
MVDDDRKRAIEQRLKDIHERVQWMADAEARSALVNGWAADGHLWPEKEKLIEESERLLDELMGKTK